MSSELLLSSVSLLPPSLSLSPPDVHQFVCRSHTTFRRRAEERANESERTHDELAEGNCEVEREGTRGEARRPTRTTICKDEKSAKEVNFRDDAYAWLWPRLMSWTST